MHLFDKLLHPRKGEGIITISEDRFAGTWPVALSVPDYGRARTAFSGRQNRLTQSDAADSAVQKAKRERSLLGLVTQVLGKPSYV